MLRVRSLGATHVGRRRKENEDAFARDDALGVFVVADGLGGHAAGEVASNETVGTIVAWMRRERAALEALAREPEAPDARARARRTLEAAVQAATYFVYGMAELDARKSGMGTTVSALVVAGARAVIAQVGDSRIYQLREGQARQVTDDHTLVNLQIKEGKLTAEQAKRSPQKNLITRAVGSHEYVEVDTMDFAVQAGDRYLLCTDGLHGYLASEEVLPQATGALAEVPGRLIDLANARGGRDNVTVVVVDVYDDAG